MLENMFSMFWYPGNIGTLLFPPPFSYYPGNIGNLIFLCFGCFLEKTKHAPKNHAEPYENHAEISHMRLIQGQKLKVILGVIWRLGTGY